MESILLDFAACFPADTVVAGPEVNAAHANAALRLQVLAGGEPRHLVLKARAGRWDVSDHLYLAVALRNTGGREAVVSVEVDSEGAGAWSNRNDVSTVLTPGEAKTVKVLIVRPPLDADGALARFFAGNDGEAGGEYNSAMLGLPGGFTWHWNRIDPRQVTQIVVSVPFPQGGEVIEILRVVAEGKYDPPTARELEHGFSPFIDSFGQYRHRVWPGKVSSPDDLAAAYREEEADLVAHPGPAGWDQYGGWMGGPQLAATGRFATIRHEGKWWLVDPEGRLFWSHGIDCVHLHWASTQIRRREHWFADLPEEDSPLAECYSVRDGERHGYNFSQANLYRKYGEAWHERYLDRVHQRLRSWGVNTVANWSAPEICLRRETPYVIDVHYTSRQIEGNRKLPDPFDRGFATAVQNSLAARSESVGDPWCIGYFVDNELSWQPGIAAAALVAAAPPDQPAKQELQRDLRARYRTVEALSAAWGTRYPSWRGFLESREAPDASRAQGDLAAFLSKLAETYFRICREQVKAADPGALYLGCRIHQPNPRVMQAAARYCDVLSLNSYKYDVRAADPTQGLDLPVIIGEWHFGALDRGPLHPGLRHVGDQSERAVMYCSYLKSALAHPLLVGAHWFQYGDEATTGRGDGENCQVGFVDVCDTPYAETVRACREVGYVLYPYRHGG
jgi:hypothetical protein